jgi:hypothetical protein
VPVKQEEIMHDEAACLGKLMADPAGLIGAVAMI